ncbi:hypothetical protein U9M48_026404 [Paspalum notatum var. saurae]|uniref:Uncharacterized protein n=1 Tax=Paspalum notatum var. saurae TaxID=547442 RepID=A0AAQ3WY65_PASNO
MKSIYNPEGLLRVRSARRQATVLHLSACELLILAAGVVPQVDAAGDIVHLLRSAGRPSTPPVGEFLSGIYIVGLISPPNTSPTTPPQDAMGEPTC